MYVGRYMHVCMSMSMSLELSSPEPRQARLSVGRRLSPTHTHTGEAGEYTAEKLEALKTDVARWADVNKSSVGTWMAILQVAGHLFA